MIIAKDKWAAKSMRSLNNIQGECDSCAAIDGARMSSSDRELVKAYCYKAMEILSKY